MGTGFLWLLGGYLAVSVFGAWTASELPLTAVLAVRVVLMAATIALLVKTYRPERLVRDLMTALAVIALVASITGLPVLAAGERLRGGLLEMHSNELSLVCAVPVIGLLFLLLNGRAKIGHLLLLVVLLGMVWATGSRTALLTVVIAFVVLLVQTRRFSPWLLVIMAAALPAIFYVAFSTDIIDEFVNRSGAGRIATLNSRSIVWEAALSPPTDWARWFGVGLATKRIPVTGQYWDEQNLDSSWASALVQAGIIGVALIVVWLVTLLVKTTRLPREPRSLIQAVLIFLILRSVLESGLIDSSPAFVVLLLLTLVVDRPRGNPATTTSSTKAVAVRSTTVSGTPPGGGPRSTLRAAGRSMRGAATPPTLPPS